MFTVIFGLGETKSHDDSLMAFRNHVSAVETVMIGASSFPRTHKLMVFPLLVLA